VTAEKKARWGAEEGELKGKRECKIILIKYTRNSVEMSERSKLSKPNSAKTNIFLNQNSWLLF
jgi:hypothetical protein